MTPDVGLLVNSISKYWNIQAVFWLREWIHQALSYNSVSSEFRNFGGGACGGALISAHSAIFKIYSSRTALQNFMILTSKWIFWKIITFCFFGFLIESLGKNFFSKTYLISAILSWFELIKVFWVFFVFTVNLYLFSFMSYPGY